MERGEEERRGKNEEGKGEEYVGKGRVKSQGVREGRDRSTVNIKGKGRKAEE